MVFSFNLVLWDQLKGLIASWDGVMAILGKAAVKMGVTCLLRQLFE